MPCIYCFFKDNYQNDLKIKNRLPKFELELKEYKKVFLKSMGEVCSCNECVKNHRFNENAVAYLDELRGDVNSRKDYIAKVFDEIIDIYMMYISQNRRCEIFSVNSDLL